MKQITSPCEQCTNLQRQLDEAKAQIVVLQRHQSNDFSQCPLPVSPPSAFRQPSMSGARHNEERRVSEESRGTGRYSPNYIVEGRLSEDGYDPVSLMVQDSVLSGVPSYPASLVIPQEKGGAALDNMRDPDGVPVGSIGQLAARHAASTSSAQHTRRKKMPAFVDEIDGHWGIDGTWNGATDGWL